VQSIQSLTAPNPGQMSFSIHPNGHLTGLSPSGISIGKSNLWVDLAVVTFSGINDSLSCIDTVIDAVNSSFERIVRGQDGLCAPLPLSVRSATLSGLLRLYPNPASDRIRLDSESEPVRWSILDLSGRLLLTSDDFRLQHSIDLAPLPDGIYLIRAEGSRNRTETLRFVLRRE